MTAVEEEFRVKVFHRIRIVAPKNCQENAVLAANNIVSAAKQVNTIF